MTRLLYHGTSDNVARKALTEGLIPRGKRKGNWKHSVDSNPDFVYLTTAYAPYFAMCACPASSKKLPAIVEVDIDKLHPWDLCPDEDAMEQGTRKDEASPVYGKSMQQRTRWFRKQLKDYAGMHDVSLKALGNCTHYGVIPPEAITRVVIFKEQINTYLIQFDPCISMLNYKFCGKRYEWLSRLPFGLEDEIEIPEMDAEAIARFKEYREKLLDPSSYEVIVNS